MLLVLALALALAALVYVAAHSLLWAVIAFVIVLVIYGGSIGRPWRWR